MTIKMTSNKSYLIKAFYDWISDNGLTPYVLVDVNVPGVLVPMSYVKDGQIVLNIALSAVGGLSLGESHIEFNARFGGKLEHLVIPYGAVGAIYAKENGAGTSLPIEMPEIESIETSAGLASVKSEPTPKAKVDSVKKGKPSLTIVKS